MLRQTILNNYEKCPMMCKLEFGTLESQLERTDNEEYTDKYTATGIVFHKAMESWGKLKISGINLELIGVHDILSEEFKEIPHNLFKNEVERKEYFNSLHFQLDWTYEKSYLIKPIACELNFTLDKLFDDIDEQFTGTIDRIDGDMSTQMVDIIDYKTGKSYTKKELSSNMQAAIYAKAFKRLFGFYPKRFVFMFTKLRQIKIIHITEEFMLTAESRIKNAYFKMKNNQYEPQITNTYFCNHFCKHTKECPLNQKRKGWNTDFEIFKPEDNVV